MDGYAQGSDLKKNVNTDARFCSRVDSAFDLRSALPEFEAVHERFVFAHVKIFFKVILTRKHLWGVFDGGEHDSDVRFNFWTQLLCQNDVFLRFLSFLHKGFFLKNR